jgi:hypothetical protein
MRRVIDGPRSRSPACRRARKHQWWGRDPDVPRRWAQKNRRPRLRTSGVAPVVPPHFAAPLARAASAARPGSSAEVHRTMHRPVNGGRSTLSGHPSPPIAPGRFRAFPSGSERGSEVFSPGVFGPASQLPRFSCPSGRQVTRPHRRRFGLHLSSDPSKPPDVCQPFGCKAPRFPTQSGGRPRRRCRPRSWLRRPQ